jgi:hypothetical protein
MRLHRGVVPLYRYIKQYTVEHEWSELTIEDFSSLCGDGPVDCKSWVMFFGYASDLLSVLSLVSAFAH